MRLRSELRRFGTMLGAPSTTILLVAALAALALVAPGRTVATGSLDELFSIFDGIHRVTYGEAPGRDFHTPLGPLTFYLPAVGEWLAGWGAAMPLAMAIAMAVLAPVATHILTSRLDGVLALAFGVFLLLILAAPLNLGEPIRSLSFAHFHNRLGWVPLSLLLVMYLPPNQPVPRLRDAACAAVLALVAIYTRATFGAVALLFLAFMLTDARQRQWAALALAAVVAAAAVVELLWGGSAGYIRANLMELEVEGLLRGSAGQIIDHLFVSFADYVLLALIGGLSLTLYPRVREALFFLLCASAGSWLINHNTQSWGILTLHAAAVVAAERVVREASRHGGSNLAFWANPTGARLFFLAMVLPTVVHFGLALGLHTAAAASGGGRPLPSPAMADVRLANLWTEGAYGGGSLYLDAIEDGLEAIGALDPPAKSLVVLGASDAFSPMLGLRPAKGVPPELGRASTTAIGQMPPEVLLSDAEVVVERVSGGGVGPASERYLPEVAAGYVLIAETEHWRIHRREPDRSAGE